MPHSPETSGEKVRDSAVTGKQRGVHRKIANAVGNTADIATDIVVDTGDIAVHTAGKGIRGLVRWVRTALGAVQGKSYEQAA